MLMKLSKTFFGIGRKIVIFDLPSFEKTQFKQYRQLDLREIQKFFIRDNDWNYVKLYYTY